MGEFMDQMMGIGPCELALPAECSVALESMAKYPNEWSWDVGLLLNPMRVALVACASEIGSGSPPHSAEACFIEYDEIVRWKREGTVWGEWQLRSLLILMGGCPAFRFGAVTVYDAARAAIKKLAAFDNSHREVQERCRCSTAAPWDMRPMQVLARLLAHIEKEPDLSLW